MIVDKIENLNFYLPMLSGLDKAEKFVTEFFKNPGKDGRYEIDGDKIFANVQSYTTKSPDEAKFEAHKKYVDLQAVVTGRECIGWVPLSSELTEVSESYSNGRDIAFYSGKTAIDTKLDARYFALLFPQDAHKPCLYYDNAPEKVTKIVVKIQAD